MKPSLALRLALRDARGSAGRLAFLSACLALGVAAVVGVASLGSALEDVLRSRSRELLGADLEVSSRSELPAELAAVLPDGEGAARADVLELAAMAGADDGAGGASGSRLVELQVVDGPYPLYGSLVLEPDRPLAELLDEGSAVVAAELLATLGRGRGDEILVGGARFRVAGVLMEQLDRLGFGMLLGPRVIVSRAGLERTDLIGFGTRMRHRALFRLPGAGPAELEALRAAIRAEVPGGGGLSIETHDEAQPGVRRGLSRVRRYLGLVALLSLVLAGVGTASIVASHLSERWAALATLRCLGLRPRDVALVQLLLVLLLALAGGLCGAAAGALAPRLLPLLAKDLLPAGALPLWQPGAIGLGLLLGLGVALLFSLPPLSALWRVPAAAVLRADAAPLPPRPLVRALAALLLVAGVYGAAWLQSERQDLSLWFTGGLLVLLLLLSLGARLLLVAGGRLRERAGKSWLRHAFAALARPGAATLASVSALGLGVLVVASLMLVEQALSAALLEALPVQAPTAFLLDVQPSQWDGVRALLDEQGASAVDSVPWVSTRLSSVAGRPVAELVDEPPPRSDGEPRPEGEPGDPDDLRRSRRRGRWVLTREQRVSWMEVLPAGNTLVAGELWSDPLRAEVSLEERYARDLGVQLGDVLAFDVQGVSLEFVVTSLRDIEWRTFGINFFVVAEPGTLEGAPHVRVVSARLDSPSRQRLRDRLVRDFPNVSLLDVEAVLTAIADLMRTLALAVRVLGWFSVAAGLGVLAGAAASTALRRRREAALLKTLGATRGDIAARLLAEYALTGLVAGLLGGTGAQLLAHGFLVEVAELTPDLPLSAVPLCGVFTAALAAAVGLAANLRALSVPPMATLRGA